MKIVPQNPINFNIRLKKQAKKGEKRAGKSLIWTQTHGSSRIFITGNRE
jgi:hypothetical protein